MCDTSASLSTAQLSNRGKEQRAEKAEEAEEAKEAKEAKKAEDAEEAKEAEEVKQSLRRCARNNLGRFKILEYRKGERG